MGARRGAAATGRARHSGGRRRALRPHHVGARRPSRSRPLLAPLFPRFRRLSVPQQLHAGPLAALGALGPRAARRQRWLDGARAHLALGLMPCRPRSAPPPAAPPLLGGGVRARAPLPPAHPRAAQQPGPQRPQQVPRATPSTARARGPSGGRRQGGAETTRRRRRRRLLLRASVGVGPRRGGDAHPQLSTTSSQPNGQVLHVLRAAAPSSQWAPFMLPHRRPSRFACDCLRPWVPGAANVAASPRLLATATIRGTYCAIHTRLNKLTPKDKCLTISLTRLNWTPNSKTGDHRRHREGRCDVG